MRLAVRTTLVAVCLGIVALAPAAASARPFEPIPTVHVTPPATRPDQTAIPPILGKTKAAEHAAIERLKAQHYTDKLPVDPAYSGAMFRGYGPRGPATVHSQSPSTRSGSGFDWGDAAIGAAAGLALTLLVAGGAMALSRRRSLRRGGANVATTA
ncbi:MAG: hypothetical protein ACXVUL_17390 [Solirubrobacteraceae bacterium]